MGEDKAEIIRGIIKTLEENEIPYMGVFKSDGNDHVTVVHLNDAFDLYYKAVSTLLITIAEVPQNTISMAACMHMLLAQKEWCTATLEAHYKARKITEPNNGKDTQH